MANDSCQSRRTTGAVAVSVEEGPSHRVRGAQWSALALLLVACSDAGRAGLPPAHSTATPGETAQTSVVSSAATPPVAEPAPAWVELVRLERFREAHGVLEQLDEAAKSSPEMRFLRARVAKEAGEPKLAYSLTEGLTLPMFADEVLALRAEAALEVGPYAEAIVYYENRGAAGDLVNAARAALRAKDATRALALADRALVSAQKSKRLTDERRAHDLRCKALHEKNEDAKAVTSLKWLATRFPNSREGKDALAQLPPAALTDSEKREVIDSLLDAGAGVEALARLKLYADVFNKAELAHQTAMAEYKARKYKAAADDFLAAARSDSPRTAEQLYYAARSLARSKREDEALKRYAEVEKRFKKGTWAERASFQRASLLQSQGRYEEASKAFTTFLAKYSKSADRDEAEYGLALSLLSANKPADAQKVFAKMAERAKKTDWGFFKELEGVAAIRAKDETAATRLFNEVAREQPLTWASAMSRARLEQLGKPLPPLIGKAEGGQALPLPVVLPAKARTLLSLGLDRDAEAWLASNESLASQPYPARETEALCAMYGQLSRAKRRYKVGSQAVSFESLMRAPAPQERWSWECLYPSPYQSRVRELEQQRKLPSGLIHGVMRQESTFDPDIRSPAGAMGLMQLMPTTAEEAAREAKLENFRADEVTVPEVNLQLGSFYLAKMLDKFEGNAALAAAAYNGGPQAVSRWVETAKELEADVFVARIPFEETRNYTMKVMTNVQRYQWLSGGDAAVAPISLNLPSKTSVGEEDY